MSAKFQDSKIIYEQHLQNKIQTVLDKVLGPDRYTVAVDAALDIASTRKQSSRYGSPSNPDGSEVEKDRIESESYKADGNGMEKDNARPMASFTTGKGENQAYTKQSHTTIRKISQVTEEKVTPPGEVKRLTASVVVDNLKPDKVAEIQQVIQGVIGYDEGRGDYVKVASIPMNHLVYDELRKEMENTRPGPVTVPYTSHLLMISAIAAIVALIITILYLYMAGKTRSAPSRLAAAAAPAATACDISDLLASKQGSPDYIVETRVHTSQRLERLAAEKPTRLAELLKSTWLSE